MTEACKAITAVIFSGGHCSPSLLPPEELAGDLYIAADSGRLTAEACGIVPHLVAGDFDSSDAPEGGASTVLRVPAEKDVTDTMLACDLAVERGAAQVRIIGGTGGRIDHELSNVYYLENLRLRGVRATICDGENRIRLAENETVVLRPGFRYFSLIALDDAVATVTGCKYPLTDAPLRRSLPYAVSNEITAEAAAVTLMGGPVLVIESR